MQNHPRTRLLMATAAITAGLTAPLVAAAKPALASGGGGVSTSGACTNGGHFELKAKHNDGKIEMEYQSQGYVSASPGGGHVGCHGAG